MNPNLLILAALLSAASPLADALSCAAAPTADNATASDHDDDDDGYYDLEGMANEALEEICTTRGFELVREDGATYSHIDYVEAAAECLRIEADLEDILRSHPEIIEDVTRERKRMEEERDALRAQLEHAEGPGDPERECDETTASDGQGRQRVAGVSEELGGESQGPGRPRDGPAISDERERTVTDGRKGATSLQNDAHGAEATGVRRESFAVADVVAEMLAQMRADARALTNFLVPKARRKQLRHLFERHVRPALAPCARVVAGTCREAYEMAHRYLTAWGVLTGGNAAEGEAPPRQERSTSFSMEQSVESS